MSQAREARRKERRKAKTPEQKALRNAIRNGKFPRFFLAKEVEGNNLLERAYDPSHPYRGPKLTWRQVGTFQALMSLPEVKPNVSEDQPQDPTNAPQGA